MTERTITVVCRNCGAEAVVKVGAPGTYIAGFLDPDACLECGCWDTVPLADLSSEELADIDRRAATPGADAGSRR